MDVIADAPRGNDTILDDFTGGEVVGEASSEAWPAKREGMAIPKLAGLATSFAVVPHFRLLGS